MNDQAGIKTLARLTALEFLVQELLYQACGSKAELQNFRTRVLAQMAKASFPQSDPAMSDLMAQEMTEALDALLQDAIRRTPDQP